jgi:Zn-dependent protease/predicted transcriptional regulator
MKYSLGLGKISGIRIEIHWTFLIVIVWIIFSSLRTSPDSQDAIWSILVVLAVFLCVVLHELGHALAAKRFDIKTTSITLLPIGGLAQMEQIPEKPKEELIIALAGPAVNLIIAALLFPVTNVSSFSDVAELDRNISPGNFLFSIMTLNVWLAVFNLIPAFPMDGGRVFRALLSFRMGHAKATRLAASVGQILAICFVFFGFFYNPFLIFIGLFIYVGAESESIYARTKSMLQGFTIKDVLMREIPVIDKNASVSEAVGKLLNSQNKNFVVTDAGNPVGTLSRDEIIRALHEQNDKILIDKIKKDSPVYFPTTTPLDRVWREIQTNKIILVADNGKLEGIVDDENLAEFILIRSANV